jgi:hypothetical protein
VEKPPDTGAETPTQPVAAMPESSVVPEAPVAAGETAAETTAESLPDPATEPVLETPVSESSTENVGETPAEIVAETPAKAVTATPEPAPNSETSAL